MTMAQKFSLSEIEDGLSKLNQGLSVTWVLRDGKLHKTFVFGDFIQAFGFMTQVALRAQAMNHHPEWFNVFKRVRVDLVTHDAGGITALDFALAHHMEGAM